MQKVLGMLCCAVLSAVATEHYLHRHRFPHGKHYHPPAIAVSRTADTLIITNLQAPSPLSKQSLQLALNTVGQQWGSAILAGPPTVTAIWPGLNEKEKNGRRAAGTTAFQMHSPALLKSDADAGAETLDIGDGATYAQLSLDRPCKTIAHCNWLGGRAIREGVPQKAIQPFRKALELATQRHDQYMTLIGYHNLAMAYWWSKHYRQAAAWAERGLSNVPATALASGQEAAGGQDASVAQD